VDEPEQLKAEIPIPEPDVPVESTLQRSITPRLDEDEERMLADRIYSDFLAAIQDRIEWEGRLAEWEDAYYNRVADKVFPWPGASNFHVPITMMGVETFKPRLVDGVLGQTPPIMVVPTKAADEDRKDKVECVLNWQVMSEMGLDATVAQSAHLFLQPGMAVAKTYWKVDRRRRKFVRSFPKGTPIQAMLEAVFGSTKPRDVEKLDELKWRGWIPVPTYEGSDLEVIVQMKYLENEVQVLVDRDDVTEGPDVDLIDPVDLIAPAKGGHEIMDLPWVQHRLWMTQDDLRRKCLLGRFYTDAVQELLDQRNGQPMGDQPQMDSGLYRQGLDRTEGIEGEGPSNARRHQYEILEDYRRYDIDGDGLDEEIITWVATDLPGRVLGWDYLDNVYAHGRRPLRVGRYFPIPFRFYGLSFAEVVKGIQDEINAIHNQRVDYATIQNLPFGFVRASATMPPITQRLRPGEFLALDDPQKDINIPKWGGSPAWAHQEEATLMQMYERVTGVTDLSIGRQPNRVGATRTASGTQTLLSESGLRFKTALQSFQRFWLGIFEDILALDQEYLPPGKEFRVTGRRPAVVRVKDRTEIRGKYDLRLAATSETLNRQQMRDDSTVVMQAIMNPALMQVGIVGLKGVRRVVTDFLKAYGKDPDFYVEEQAPVRSVNQKLQLFVTGQYVPPSLGENPQTQIPELQAALQDPIVKPEVKQLIQRHLQEFMQLQQAQQMAQMLQQSKAAGPGGPQIGPQAVNAQQGQMAPQPTQPGNRARGGMGMPAPNGPSAG
jgi:hypothetical protein